jgi:hypothetical protein
MPTSVTFTNQNGPGDTGGTSFTGGTTTTTQLDGRAAAIVQMTSIGRARFKPTFNSPQFAQLLYRPSEEALARLGDTYDAATDEIVVPRYRAVGKRPIRVLGAQGDRLVLQDGPTTAIAVEQLATRQEGRGGAGPSGRSVLAAAQISGGAAPDSPKVQKPQPRPLGAARQPLVITSCAADLEVFSETGVSAPQINLPFTVDLTDLSPSTGQTLANGLVDCRDAMGIAAGAGAQGRGIRRRSPSWCIHIDSLQRRSLTFLTALQAAFRTNTGSIRSASRYSTRNGRSIGPSPGLPRGGGIADRCDGVLPK